MDNWAQVFSGIATVAFLVGSTAGLFCLRSDYAQDQRSGAAGSTARFSLIWRIGTLVGIGALVASTSVRSATASTSGWLPLADVAGRATAIALVASLFGLSQDWRSLVRSGHRSPTWGVWFLVAVVTGIGILSWPENDTSASLLLGCTIMTAGVGLWSIGHNLDVLVAGQKARSWPFLVAFAGLTATIVGVGAVNWWVWGTPAGLAVGNPSTRDAFVAMLAVWLVGAAVLVLRRRADRVSFGLGLAYAAMLVGIALSVQWKLPFN